MTIELATEEQTHEPIMTQRSELNILFFQDLINELTLKHPDLLIFDRLYITQAYRTKSDLVKYTLIEDSLMPYSPHTILLKVDEATIADRIKATAVNRGLEWQKFWKSKGSSFEEIAKGYIDQQRGLLQLVKQSKLPYAVFNTTNHDYGSITEDILKLFKNE